MQPEDIDEVPADSVPVAPWHLRGSACLSLWRVPEASLAPAPAGMSYVTLAGCTLVLTVWAAYAPGGTLQYDELAVAVPVRGKGLLAPACTVSAIWVSDAAAAAGGRRLWGIPKALGQFHIASSTEDHAFSGRLSIDGEAVASLSFEPGLALPGRPALAGFVIQPGDGGPLRTRCAGHGKVVTGRATWDFSATGALAFLHGRQPLFSARISSLQMSFGV